MILLAAGLSRSGVRLIGFLPYLKSLNPLGLWMADDVGATGVDQSGNGRNGTYEGLYTQGRPSLLPNGQFGSTRFRSNTPLNGAIRIADEAALRVTSAASMVAFVRSDTLFGSFGYTFGKLFFNGSIFNNGYALRYFDSTPSLQIITSGTERTLNGSQLDTLPHMLAATWEGSAARLYVDGQPIASSGTWAAAGDSTGSDLMIGSASGNLNSAGCDGDRQALTLFNYRLNDAQVLRIWQEASA